MSKIRWMLEHTEDCDKGLGECTCGANDALAELKALEAVAETASRMLDWYKDAVYGQGDFEYDSREHEALGKALQSLEEVRKK